MSKKLTATFALVAGMTLGMPAVASAYGYGAACPPPPPRPVYHQPVCKPVCKPVCQPVCNPCCDPCRRSGLFGLGILGIL